MYVTTLKASASNQHTWDLPCGCILLAIVISSDQTLTCCLPIFMHAVLAIHETYV